MAEVFSVKPIRPKRLKVDRVRMEILNELRAEGREQCRILKPTTDNWQGEKPGFEFLIGLTGTDASLLVGPVGSTHAVQKWTWLDEGTKAHAIVARRKPRLKFRRDYMPSTTPGEFTSKGAVKYGPWRSPVAVWHPGIEEPRGWSALLQKRRKQPFVERMNRALKRGMEKAL